MKKVRDKWRWTEKKERRGEAEKKRRRNSSEDGGKHLSQQEAQGPTRALIYTTFTTTITGIYLIAYDFKIL